jgi:hypothetical protein
MQHIAFSGIHEATIEIFSYVVMVLHMIRFVMAQWKGAWPVYIRASEE